VRNGFVYTTSYFDNVAYCFKASDGSRVWATPLPEHVKVQPGKGKDEIYWVGAPAAYGSEAFVAPLNYDGQRSLFGFDPENGKIKWEYRRGLILFFSTLADEENNIVYLPVFANGLQKFSMKDGTLLGHLPLEAQYGFKIGDEMILDLTNMGRLMKVRIKKNK
jgi:outer membrane protein assembly factor BamB